MRTFMLRIGLGLALVALFGAAPAAAKQVPEGPTLVVANPSSGDMLTPGALTIQGVAFDTAATEGTGVDRVSIFLENRDFGGFHLGDATLGEPSLMSVERAQFAPAGWVLTTPALKGAGDGRNLFVYARSAVTGEETVIQIPVTIGEKSKDTGSPTQAPTEPME